MVALRCTARLLKRFGLSRPPDPLPPSTVLGDWFVNSFAFARRPHVLFTSERSLLSVILLQSPQGTLVPRFREALKARLHQVELSVDEIESEILEMSDVVFAATNSRRVLGCMKEFLLTIKLTAPARPAWTTGDFESEINDTPCGPLGYASPAEASRRLFREGAIDGLRPGQG